mgnify:CR=1 FL=1
MNVPIDAVAATVPELVKWRSYYQQQVRSEDAAASLANGVAPGGKWLARL